MFRLMDKKFPSDQTLSLSSSNTGTPNSHSDFSVHHLTNEHGWRAYCTEGTRLCAVENVEPRYKQFTLLKEKEAHASKKLPLTWHARQEK